MTPGPSIFLQESTLEFIRKCQVGLHIFCKSTEWILWLLTCWKAEVQWRATDSNRLTEQKTSRCIPERYVGLDITSDDQNARWSPKMLEGPSPARTPGPKYISARFNTMLYPGRKHRSLHKLQLAVQMICLLASLKSLAHRGLLAGAHFQREQH